MHCTGYVHLFKCALCAPPTRLDCLLLRLCVLFAVLHAGPSTQMNWFTTDGDGGRRAAGERPGGDQMCGNAVMYHTGKILACGGGPAYEDRPATDAASVLEIQGKNVKAREIKPLNKARSMANGVAMPDGKVLIVGGLPMPKVFSDRDWISEVGAAFLR